MCRAADFLSTVMLLVWIGACVPMGILQHRFLSRLENSRPSLWKELGHRKVWTDDGNKSYAAAQWYLVRGEYKSLGDHSLIDLGNRARNAFFGILGVFLAWGFVSTLTQG